jgi:S1-C subfamily serine protease
MGTGFIYDKQGHVLTNAHVVSGSTTLLVTTANGDAQEAKLIGIDPRTDVAVLQISGSSLPTAALGEPSKLKVGDWTVAIGHALGLPGGPTVTAGVLSAVGRHVQEPSDTNSASAGPYLFDMLQTDAPINPGNSGGPLVNVNGEVIGMNTLVAGQAEEGVPAQGIGFAIPIDRAKSIADLLVKDGKVAHSSLGVSFAPVNPAIALQLGAKQGTKGAAIGQVASGSAAAKAGLRSRDIVTKVDGNDVKEESDLPRLIDQKKPGDKVNLTVLRDGSEQTLQATLDQAS